jgi:hypothetical protein
MMTPLRWTYLIGAGVAVVLLAGGGLVVRDLRQDIQRQADMSMWHSVRASNDVDQLVAYLDTFPAGRFAEQARDQVAALTQAAASGGGVQMTAGQRQFAEARVGRENEIERARLAQERQKLHTTELARLADERRKLDEAERGKLAEARQAEDQAERTKLAGQRAQEDQAERTKLAGQRTQEDQAERAKLADARRSQAQQVARADAQDARRAHRAERCQRGRLPGGQLHGRRLEEG